MAKAGHEILAGSLDGYSLIFKRTMNDGRVAAVKRVITGTTDINEVNKLIELSKHKQHENVIRYFLIEQQDPYCFIYLELCSGNLCDFVEDPSFDSGGLDQKTAVKQIALGLEHIHRNGIYHLDLKPGNILISCGSRKRIVLADFEVSKNVYDGKESIRTRTFGGTIGWIAPEIEYFHECEHRLTRKADIFSFGLLVHYVLTHGSHLFSHKNFQKPVKLSKESSRFEIGAEHISELIKAIRNYWRHYSEADQKVFDVGSLPSPNESENTGYTSLDSFTKNFPQLLLHTYEAAVPWRDDVKLREFYPKGDFPKFWVGVSERTL